MKYLKILFPIFCALIVALAARAEPSLELTTFAEPEGEVAGYENPIITVSPRGIVMAFATEKHGHRRGIAMEQRCVLWRSFDGGKTWREKQYIGGEDFHCNTVAPVIDHENGKVILLGSSIPKETNEGQGMTETWIMNNQELARRIGGQLFLMISRDEGNTWTRPLDISEGFWTYPQAGIQRPAGEGVQLTMGEHKGRLVIPTYHFSEHATELDATARNSVIYSDDGGANWSPGGRTQQFSSNGSVLQLQDGRLLFHNVNHDPRMEDVRTWALSHSDGEEFDKFGPFKDLKQLGPVRGGTIRYQDEPVVLFSNPGTERRNFGMTVYMSKDDARSWPVKRVVDEDFGTLSDLAVNADGEILLLYESRGGSLKLARFNKEWVEAGESNE